MKTSYGLLNENGQVIKSFTKLADLEDFKHEIENRRTGRTTRAIFRALAEEAKEVVIVVQNPGMCAIVLEKLYDILKGLHFTVSPGFSRTYISYYGKTISVHTKQYVQQHKFPEGTVIIEDLDK